MQEVSHEHVLIKKKKDTQVECDSQGANEIIFFFYTAPRTILGTESGEHNYICESFKNVNPNWEISNMTAILKSRIHKINSYVLPYFPTSLFTIRFDKSL